MGGGFFFSLKVFFPLGCHGGRSFFDSHALLQSGLGLYSRVPPPATTPNPVPRSGSSNGATGGASGSGSCANFGSFSQQVREREDPTTNGGLQNRSSDGIYMYTAHTFLHIWR